MATKRTVQFEMDFDVQNLNTIEELENSLEEINKELKGLDTNSEAFKGLAKQAQAADGKLRTINDSLGGVTSAEKAEGILKLGEGLAGAFAIGASASIFFGERASENIEKTVAAVGSLVIALDGIKKVTEALSAQNLKFVKGAISGFRKSAIAAKLFGSTTRKALISTGIGAIVVAIGLIIANFDKLRKAAKDNSEKIKKALLVISPPLFLIIKAFDAIKKSVGDIQNLIAGLGKFFKSIFTFDDSGLKGATEEFRKEVELQKELDYWRGELNKKIKETEKAYERELTLLREQGANEEEINELIRQRLEEEQEIYEALVKSGRAKDEELERLEEINFQLQVQTIREQKLVERRKKESTEQNKRDKEAAARQAERLKAQQESAKERLKELRLSFETYQNEERYSELLEGQVARLEMFSTILNGIFEEEQKSNAALGKKSELYDLLIEGVDEYRNLQSQITEGDKTGNRILEERSKSIIPSQVRVTEEAYNKLTSFINRNREALGGEIQDIEDLGVALEKNVSLARNSIELNSNSRRLKEDELNAAAEQLGIVKTITDLQTDQLEKTNATLDARKDFLGTENDILEIEKETLLTEIEADQRRIKNLKSIIPRVKDEERRNQLIEERKRLEGEIEPYLSRAADLDDQITENKDEQAEVTAEILDNQEEINKVTEEYNKTLGEVTTTVVNQSRLYKDIQEQAQIFGETLMQGVQAFGDLQKAVAQNAIDELKTAADEWYTNNLDKIESLKEESESYADLQNDLNDLLRDAEGDRYDDLLAQIKAAEQAEKDKANAAYELEKQGIDMENTIIQAENEQAVEEKKQALIAAAIQTALAVIQALPNIPLSIVTGVLGAAGIAAIATQKPVQKSLIPYPKAPAAEGMLIGNSHAAEGVSIEAEGGEFVVNKAATRAFLPLIEKINSAGKKYAEGDVIGQSAPTTLPQTDDLIDYSRLAEAIASRPQFVSVVEFREVENRLNVVEARSSF